MEVYAILDNAGLYCAMEQPDVVTATNFRCAYPIDKGRVGHQWDILCCMSLIDTASHETSNAPNVLADRETVVNHR